MRDMKAVKALLPLAAGLCLWGCATSQDVRILDREINRLQSQVNTLQKEGQREKEVQSGELAVLRTVFKNEWSTELKKLQTDLLFRIEKNESEIRILNTGLDEYKDFAKRPSKDVERVREDVILRTRVLEEREKMLEDKNRAVEDRAKVLEEKNRAMEDRARVLEEKIRTVEDRIKGTEGRVDQVAAKQTEAEKAAAAPKEKEPVPEVKSPTTVPATGMAEIYKDAFETYQKGDIEGARRKFETFLKQYPNTDLSDNAQFWIGETYFVKKDYERAVLEYEKVTAKYPEGDKVPAAMFKQALAFLELGDKANARNIFRRVIERYPQSDQADLAKKRLETIK